jgi:hypothetical protein
VEGVDDGSTTVGVSGVGVGVGSIIELLEDGSGVSAGGEDSGVGVGVGSMIEVLEGVGVSAGGEASGVDVGVSDALWETSTLEELGVGVDGSEELTTEVTIDEAASVEENELMGDAELLSNDIGAVSEGEADGVTELEAEIVGTSTTELETTVGASGIEVAVMEVLEVLNVRGSAVDMLEELSMMDNEVSELVELDKELMFSLALLETAGVADETGEGLVMADDVIDEREEDDPLLHLPNPPWQPVPQYADVRPQYEYWEQQSP